MLAERKGVNEYMKKSIALFLLVLSFGASAVSAEKPLGVDEFNSVDELAGAIAAYFPKVQGVVTAVQNDKLTLTLSNKEGLTPGMELTLWRDGKEILHPQTGMVIGHMEDEVGMVEVVAAGDTSSTAVVKKKLRQPQAGDKARITPKKINLAIVPLTSERPEFVQGLSERLIEYGRFTVLDKEKVAGFLKEKKQRDSSLVKELGRQFSVDAVVALSVYPTEGKLLVMTRIFYTQDAGLLDTIVATVDLKSKKDVLGEIKPFFIPVREEKSVTPELPFDSRYFTAADFEGDGKLEYAFSDGSKLHVYRQEAAGWREVWTETVPPASVSTGTGDTGMKVTRESIQHINIDSADINGNGKPEIFVTAMLNGKVFSYVVEFQDGAFRRIADVPGFLRVVSYPGKSLMLLGQDYDPKTFYSGQPKLYSWQDGKYVPGAEFPLPKGVVLYGFTFASLGEDQPLLVAFDDDDYLLVYSKGAVIWKSAEKYAAAITYVYKPATGIGGVLAKDAIQKDKSLRVRIPGRVFAVDINGDGRDEIIVPKNIGDTFLGIAGIKGAEVDSLSWTGARLEQRWNIKDIPGAVLDFQLLRSDKGRTQVLTLVRTKGNLFTKDRQQVMSYLVK
jgi:FG-GAP-like repeat